MAPVMGHTETETPNRPTASVNCLLGQAYCRSARGRAEGLARAITLVRTARQCLCRPDPARRADRASQRTDFARPPPCPGIWTAGRQSFGRRHLPGTETVAPVGSAT